MILLIDNSANRLFYQSMILLIDDSINIWLSWNQLLRARFYLHFIKILIPSTISTLDRPFHYYSELPWTHLLDSIIVILFYLVLFESWQNITSTVPYLCIIPRLCTIPHAMLHQISCFIILMFHLGNNNCNFSWLTKV